ncbi:MAG TPA: hypothetical protein VHB50_13980 [Bryobacteraceae bacterium]|jgi:hypothetical protein|nr:hypothetical protein [Bryobacteraceae bacterium]
MTKPYHEMTPAERLAARIAKNREIEQRVMEKKPAETASSSSKKQPSGEIAARSKAVRNVLDRFQEIKRTQGIDAASDYVQSRIKSVNE